MSTEWYPEIMYEEQEDGAAAGTADTAAWAYGG